MSVTPEEQAEQAEALLIHYSFDLGGKPAYQIVANWTQNYEVSWLPLAIIEALYLGRYKAISVGQILAHWKRREEPVYHFNSEFERLVSNNLPPHLTGNFTEKKGDSTAVEGSQNDVKIPPKKSDRTPPPPIHYSDFYEKLKSLLNVDLVSGQD
ncbi:hypothetical protein [Lyngbya sp. CCY1209]|uniref:hypothetical protein n=1 Tax=Lyngbya sp. CCY1209 TaxID=2886103 RepID=UPI002D2113BC|nr:hypothetical protein [Lyngbya sp. CCY1209]MEB3883887.1 hypothetical protein [Lyngbya sp. CCY1209]